MLENDESPDSPPTHLPFSPLTLAKSPLSQKSPVFNSTIRIDPLKERMELFYNEPILFAYVQQDPTVSVENIKSFLNNQNNKGNIDVAEQNIKLGRMYLKRKKTVPMPPLAKSKGTVMDHIESKGLYANNPDWINVDAEVDTVREKLNEVLEKHKGVNACLEEQFKVFDEEGETISSVLENYEQKILECKLQKKTLARLKQEMYKKERDLEALASSELATLERKVGILEERAEMHKRKSQELKGLSLQIQAAETKLRRKSERLSKLERHLQSYSNDKMFAMGETDSMTKQLKILAAKNEQLEKNINFAMAHKEALAEGIESAVHRKYAKNVHTANSKQLESTTKRLLNLVKEYKQKHDVDESPAHSHVLQQQIEAIEEILLRNSSNNYDEK